MLMSVNKMQTYIANCNKIKIFEEAIRVSKVYKQVLLAFAVIALDVIITTIKNEILIRLSTRVHSFPLRPVKGYDVCGECK